MVLYKNTFIKIKKSLGRYLSLFLIVLIGVGFFTGIQASAPNLIDVADNYYRDYQLMDFKVVSTLGFTEDDVKAIEKLPTAATVTPSYSLDVLEQDKSIRLHALESSVNKPELTKGRLPEKDSECIADEKNYALGDTIKITGDSAKDLKNKEYTVVGLANSVLYVAADYGTSTVGDGKLASFAFIPKDNYQMEAYTEIYVTAKGASSKKAYSENYQKIADTLNGELTSIKTQQENNRYQGIQTEALLEIASNEQELHDEKLKGEQELAEAKTTLDEGYQELNGGKQKLTSSETHLLSEEKKQGTLLESAKTEINNGWLQIDSALNQYQLTRASVGAAISQLEQQLNNMKAQLGILDPISPEYAQITATIAEYTLQYEGLLKVNDSMNTLATQEAQLNQGVQQFTSEIANGKNEITRGWQEISSNEQKLNEGFAEYDLNLEKFQKEISDGEKKIAEAKEDISNLEHPQWYISDRDAAVGYSFFSSSVEVVSSIAAIFPFFFILIAVLMTSNSMARMIAEERGELGALTSLGYNNRRIIGTYLLYVLSAAGIGGIAGFFIGGALIPPLIYSNFQMILPPLPTAYNLGNLLIILGVTLVIMTLVTLLSCYRELKHQPATLLRPVPPKSGQKIILERVGILWKHLSFTWKITLRNLFRYKKRAFMTIVGVAGCAALMLVGFGLKDSMDGVADRQFGKLSHYDSMIILKDETKTLDTSLVETLTENQVQDPLLIKQMAIKCSNQGETLNTYLIVPEDEFKFPDYYTLLDLKKGTPLALDNKGAIITQKIADLYQVGIGDTIEVEDGDSHPFTITVAGIAENYTSHYIYMNQSGYESTFGEAPLYNGIVSQHAGDETTLSKNLMEEDSVLNVILTTDLIQQLLDTNSNLDSIIILLVAVASLLAIIVLYNLTSINISERTREIATLKVLGFRDGETNSYIYREALLLTLISIFIGLLLGVVLLGFVITVIEGTSMVLLRNISWISFLLSALLTLVFSIIMQVVTYFKLKSVDMIESLKSVE